MRHDTGIIRAGHDAHEAVRRGSWRWRCPSNTVVFYNRLKIDTTYSICGIDQYSELKLYFYWTAMDCY